MQLIGKNIAASLQHGSWIRQMFEQGIALKKQYGEEAVCDFTLGNPDLPPPPIVGQTLHRLGDEADKPFSMGYMPNGGFMFAREALAAYLTKEQGISLQGTDVVLSCGAAGGLNAFFKTVLEPGDEVLAFAPYFVEYGSYVSNHQGVFHTVATQPHTFSIDLDALEQAITERTRVVMINSPNNPTGQIYTESELRGIVALLEAKSAGRERPIYLISDEPYRFLAFDGAQVPSLLPLYRYAVVISSFSKNLSLPGERIGYVAVSPLMEGRDQLVAGLIFANRILGFVNPPVVGQHLMVAALGSQVDASIYARRRAAMAEVLQAAGYDFMMPKGAFYFFPQAPGGDDVAFVDKLMKHLVLAVPGRGFGGPGHFRLVFCVDEEVIYRAADGLRKARME